MQDSKPYDSNRDYPIVLQAVKDHWPNGGFLCGTLRALQANGVMKHHQHIDHVVDRDICRAINELRSKGEI